METTAPPPTLQNPIPGTTVETSPSRLGLNNGEAAATPLSDNESQDKLSGSGLLSRTLDKLSRSKSLSAKKSDRKASGESARSSKRLSMSGIAGRRKKNANSTGDNEESGADAPRVATNGNAALSADMSNTGSGAASETSSRPESPPPIRYPYPSRSELGGLASFKGDGSMRAGTQTLIQALHAIPWEDDREEDAASGERPSLGTRKESALSSDDDDEETKGRKEFLASSIHAIHRPVARSRRGTPAARAAGPSKPRSPQAGYFPATSESELPDDEDSDTDERDDFENVAAGGPALHLLTGDKSTTSLRVLPGGSKVALTASPTSAFPPGASAPTPTRQGSMATVRMRRKARLAEKLQEVFGLKQLEDVVAEMPCWLLRSVLLQGYMYLTSAHICFFAHMPSREDQVLKSGSLSKKSSRTKRWTKHWFVLKNDVLSWYSSAADPYFPHGNVDLRYAITCESVGEREIKLRTNQKTLNLQADSIPSRDEWVKAVRKVMFKAQNHGESVKISLPYSAIIDVEKSTAMDFSDTIEVKVVDKDDNFAIDSYFFAYFHNLPAALVQIRECVQAYKSALDADMSIVPSSTVRDTTTAARATVLPPALTTTSTTSTNTSQAVQSVQSLPPPQASQGSSSRFSLHITSLLGLNRTASAPNPSEVDRIGEDFTHVTYAPAVGGTNLPQQPSDVASTPRAGSVRTLQPTGTDHTYPPSSSLEDSQNFERVHMTDAQGHTVQPSGSALSGYVPSWLKSKKIFGSSDVSPVEYDDSARVQEIYEARPGAGPIGGSHASSTLSGATDNQLGFSILEAPANSDTLDPQIVDKFKGYFALDEKEQVLGYFPGYLFRVLPLFGRVYISTNFFCYRSGQPLRKTLMKIPIRDIISTEESKAFRFGHHGLIVIIKGHEELFFEFSSADKRAACVALLNKQIDELQRRSQVSTTDVPSKSEKDALILEELEPAGFLGESALYQEGPRPPPETDTLPAVMFTSNSSTFLAFKPEQKMHITCLTIGSRGDCQPYIALCKRLQQDGHTCRIATHEEYKDWVEGHGVQFTAVGGDPAELMRICVENGMFTVGFLKETLQKFRGWLDDLLATSWKACQGTDLLIESPSAMGGIHIAEALRIPYFRAFTMPYTRTRTYPHAFAVPERKMGGSYNYMTYVMFDQVFWRAISGQINRWRRNTLGIQSTTFDKLEQHKVPFLYNFSPSLVPPPLDWYEWIRVTGYWFLDDADDSAEKKWSAPPDLVSFIDSAHALGKKVVYIGFGSIVVSDPEAMTRAVVGAIEASGVYAILSKGWSDRLATKKNNVHPEVPEIKLPPQVYPIKSIPHDWLFPKIDAACHHGGAGTTGASLRAGIPTIIKPFFGDQFFWADRVEALDVGSAVRKLTVDNLTEALKVATTDVKQIEKAKLLGQKIRAEKGVDNAVEAIYRDLEYARSLIKHPATPDHEPSEAIVGGTRRTEGTPDRSATDSSMHESNQGGTSEWSVISGEEGEDRLRPSREHERSPSPQPTSKRASISGALSALGSAIPKPSLSKRLSHDSRSTDRH